MLLRVITFITSDKTLPQLTKKLSIKTLRINSSNTVNYRTIHKPFHRKLSHLHSVSKKTVHVSVKTSSNFHQL